MSLIKINNENGISEITIDRPEALNAMNQEVVAEFSSVLQDAVKEKETGAIIITGAGDKAFIAGADIKAMQKMTADEALIYGRAGQKLTMLIESSPKPVIAAVNGFALGGGCEIAMACHVRIASENASFGQPEVKLGLLPGWGGTQRLPKIIGVGQANELITTGKIINAQEALRIGLINVVVAQDELLLSARKMASTILRNGPRAIASSLHCIKEGLSVPIKKGMEIEAQEFSKLFHHDERMEGLTAFIEKRPADFRD